MYDLNNRILGSLVCAGMGDALGAPTEGLSYDQILERFNGPIVFFEDPKDHFVSFNNHAGEVTDDASQMWELAQGVIRCQGKITEKVCADALLAWSENWPKYYPQQAGPTMRDWVKLYAAGQNPVELGMKGETYSKGITNGAVMRVAPAALINPGDLEKAIDDAYKMTRITHGTQHAISGACAISCAIAEALKEDSTIDSIVKAAIYGAKKGEKLGLEHARKAFGPRVLPMLIKAIEIAYSADSPLEANRMMDEAFGLHYDVQPTTAAAVGVFIANNGDPIECIKAAANFSGDTDTLGCVTGMIAGAFKGFDHLDKKYCDFFFKANPEMDFIRCAAELTQIAENKIS